MDHSIVAAAISQRRHCHSKIGSRFLPPDAHNMFNARLLGNDRYHGSYMMADIGR